MQEPALGRVCSAQENSSKRLDSVLKGLAPTNRIARFYSTCSSTAPPPTMSSDALDERRSYTAPMQVSETPSRHGTSVTQRADMVCISIPRSKSQTQDMIGTTPGRTSLSGRVRSASTNIKDVIGSCGFR